MRYVLKVRLTGVHGARSDGVDADAAAGQLLRYTAREVLHRRLAAGITVPAD